ncbi:DinB family protein [Paenibacillus antri]|uniref:DinB family protein n=1 Tax=Paenibacillus antri TaxID=2582848 RepID=A0A5R9FYA5_9BACL|nr:DinB family protein [Paenibacillus antri]TLS48471.1 DinB family protein [Paenibacillus antri]
MTNGTAKMKEQLFEEFELGMRTAWRLIGRIRPEQWSYRPADNMRTLQELVHHIASLPEVDVMIAKEATEDEVRAAEKTYARLDCDAEALTAAMGRGFEGLKQHYGAMSDEEFLHRATTPYYVNHPTLQSRWLLETVTHLFHHRSQLFQYVKALGHDVTMMDLYVL